MEYRRLGADEVLPVTTLCAVGFGNPRLGPQAAQGSQALRVQVGLPILVGTGMTELWHAQGAIQSGREGVVDFACDAHYLAGRVEIDEPTAGGLREAAQAAYQAVTAFTTRSGHPHLLRMYNYFSAINDGAGDAERYKLFCCGRAAGFGRLHCPGWPAASAIGRQGPAGPLQVYWLASSSPGRAIENPRQVSAFNYPRQYGPAPPSFSRAMQMHDGLLVSGTGSVLGHSSHHAGDLAAQLEEILRNLASVRQAAGPSHLPHSGRSTLLKVYLRDPTMAGFVAQYLRANLPAAVQFIILGADICRRELLVEIDAVHLTDRR